MVALSQPVVSTSRAARIWAWRALRRVVTRMLRSPAVRWWTRILFNSANARRGVMIWSGRSGSQMSAAVSWLAMTASMTAASTQMAMWPADALFGPVIHGSQAEEVFHHAESVFDVGQALVVGDDLGGRGLVGGEGGGQHVTAGEQALFVVDGGRS